MEKSISILFAISILCYSCGNKQSDTFGPLYQTDSVEKNNIEASDSVSSQPN